MSAHRQPSPGPSFIREETVPLRDVGAVDGRVVRLGMTQPSVMEDGWWLTVLWAEDEHGVVPARDLAPVAGPPPEPPVAALGRVMAGALAGLLDQEDERQLIRVRMPPPADAARPWERPVLLWTAVRWDPVRASVMRENELARELLRAFARAVEAAGSPGAR